MIRLLKSFKTEINPTEEQKIKIHKTTSKDGYIIKSGTISMKAGRYYVSALVEVTDPVRDSCFSDGVGIDLGLKNLAIISNGTVYRNINKTARIRKLEKQLRRAQRKLSRKYENLKKGEPTQKANIRKQKLSLLRTHQKRPETFRQSLQMCMRLY